ncbi:sugar transporter [Flavobacterium magnum]|uniref:Sugar transporter n=1 Tax=Flavobacterium magnum TaxID=2162713 RepID=A0A2S0RAQ0_9FLAO|nr:polysaccharide biosynthesis/export family protein [Flavobacterium magnum]AWA28659.1 sugar transporter [Flavobacterium magnum]
MRIRLWYLLLLGTLLTSCIPTKDMIYLQNKSDGAAVSPVNPISLKPYRLQTNDIISINIKAIDQKLVAIFSPSSKADGNSGGESESSLYFNGFTVDDHGNIRIPILGEVNVLGFTLDEVRVKIEKELLETYFNKEADIFVNVKLAGIRYTTSGEVTSPGTKTLFTEKLNILEALANSGDVTITGDRKSVTVIRQFPYGTEMHDIDLTDIKAIQSPYYYIQPNDYIFVKPLKQKSWGTGKTGIESLTTIVTILSLATTTFLLLKN